MVVVGWRVWGGGGEGGEEGEIGEGKGKCAVCIRPCAETVKGAIVDVRDTTNSLFPSASAKK